MQRYSCLLRLGMLWVMGFFWVRPGHGQERYVTPTGAGARNGLNWDNAYSNIQSAINDCLTNGTVYLRYGTWEVWPELNIENASGLRISGGYVGVGSPGDRTNEPSVITIGFGRTNRLMHCRNSTVTLDQITLAGGKAGPGNTAYTPTNWAYYGGAIYATNCNLVITNCVIRNNLAYYPLAVYNMFSFGGGICFMGVGTLQVEGCQFISNLVSGVTTYQDPQGGAIYTQPTNSVLIVRDSLFVGNLSATAVDGKQGTTTSCRLRGGSIYSGSLSNLLDGCVFYRNYDDSLNRFRSCGDIWLSMVRDSTATVANCIILQNAGYGLRVSSAATSPTRLTVSNCLIAANSVDGIFVERPRAGSAIAQCTVVDNGRYGYLCPHGFGIAYTITNCIFRGNAAGGISLAVAPAIGPRIWNTYSQESYGTPATTNAVNTNDPYLVCGYFLSKAGLPGQTVDSPCLNAGGTLASVLGLGERATTTEGSSDTGIVDLGFHYSTNRWMDLLAVRPLSATEISNRVLYVDAATGNDGFDGWTPSTALRTLTAALGRTVYGSEIRLSAGTYSAASGETFPLNLRDPNVTLRGAGPQATVIRGDGATRVITSQAGGNVRLESLCIENGGGLNGVGGGIYVDAGAPTVSNCIIRGNRVRSPPVGENAYGGGMCVNGCPTLTVVDSQFISNNASCAVLSWDAYGGGLCVLPYADFFIGSVRCSRVSFVANSLTNAISLGAGFSMPTDYGVFFFDRCVFSNNWIRVGGSYAANGGGFYTYNSYGGTLSECRFQGNVARDGSSILGEALYLYFWYGGARTSRIEHCVFQGNGSTNATPRLGAVWVGGYGSPNYRFFLDNCLFSRNVSNEGYYAASGSSGVVVNCTFADNGRRGAVLSNGWSEVRNCIAWGNAAGVGIVTGGAGVVSISYTDSQELHSGPGNLNVNPLFVTGPWGEYYLSPASPCVDAGGDTAADRGLTNRTTRADEGLDTGMVDLGYHYGLSPPRPGAAGSLWMIR